MWGNLFFHNNSESLLRLIGPIGFLRRNLYACPQEVKEAAYKGLVRPVLEYSGSVWDPSGVGLQNELEKVQNRAARFVTGTILRGNKKYTVFGFEYWISCKWLR